MRRFTFFPIPKQVIFADPDDYRNWQSGIAIGKTVINGATGVTYHLDDIYAYVPKGIRQPLYVYSYWLDISAEIVGGNLPRGLELVDGEIREY